MAHLPTAVTIVTAAGEPGPAGATANAVASLSLDPPLILACLDRGSRTLGALLEAGEFGVSILGAAQEQIARGFATKAPHREKWRDIGWDRHGEIPILHGAVAWATCRVCAVHPGGDHAIVVGEVLGLGASGGEPLVFWAGAYRPLEG